MLRATFVASLVFLAIPAAAQDSSATDRVALQIGRLEIANANLTIQAEMLQRQLAEAQARIKQLEEKQKPESP